MVVSRGGTHNLLLAELREQAEDSVKPSSRQMVDATLRVKPYKAPRAEAETDGDSEMTPAASEAGANGDAAPAAEDSEMNSS